MRSRLGKRISELENQLFVLESEKRVLCARERKEPLPKAERELDMARRRESDLEAEIQDLENQIPAIYE